MFSRVFGKFGGQTLKNLQNIYTGSRFEYPDAGNNEFEFFALKHEQVCCYAKYPLTERKH
jgi:hypothetical protein